MGFKVLPWNSFQKVRYGDMVVLRDLLPYDPKRMQGSNDYTKAPASEAGRHSKCSYQNQPLGFLSGPPLSPLSGCSVLVRATISDRESLVTRELNAVDRPKM